MDDITAGAANAGADEAPAKASFAEKRWQSDIIVDLIKHYDFPYIKRQVGYPDAELEIALLTYEGQPFATTG